MIELRRSPPSLDLYGSTMSAAVADRQQSIRSLAEMTCRGMTAQRNVTAIAEIVTHSPRGSSSCSAKPRSSGHGADFYRLGTQPNTLVQSDISSRGD